jgi:hypothetical protein
MSERKMCAHNKARFKGRKGVRHEPRKETEEYYVEEKWEIHLGYTRARTWGGTTVRDIVDYEIGSGYGFLNDAENVSPRRRRRL